MFMFMESPLPWKPRTEKEWMDELVTLDDEEDYF